MFGGKWFSVRESGERGRPSADVESALLFLLVMISFASLSIDPGVRFVQQQPYERDVVATKACGFFPDVAVPEESRNRHGVTQTGAGLATPDTDFD